MYVTSSDLAAFIYHIMPVIAVSAFLAHEQKEGLMWLTERNTDTKEKEDREKKIRGMFAAIIEEVGIWKW